MPEVTKAVDTLEKRLRRAQIQRIILLWMTVTLFALVGVLFLKFRDNAIEGCVRGTQAAVERAELAKRVGALELSRKAMARAHLDCSDAYSWF